MSSTSPATALRTDAPGPSNAKPIIHSLADFASSSSDDESLDGKDVPAVKATVSPPVSQPSRKRLFGSTNGAAIVHRLSPFSDEESFCVAVPKRPAKRLRIDDSGEDVSLIVATSSDALSLKNAR